MSPVENAHPSTRLREHGSLGPSVMWAYIRTAVVGLIGVPATQSRPSRRAAVAATDSSPKAVS
jgi:hypothetical protein